jgi:hypothetical protein
MKSAAHYRLRRRLGVVLSYLGVAVALAFFSHAVFVDSLHVVKGQ